MDWKDIEAARALKKLTYLWEKGLGARVSKTGEISWLVQRWEGGRTGQSKRIVIGHYPVMTLEEARQIAQADGIHTLGEVVNTYFTIRRKPGRFWAELEARFKSEVVAGLGSGRVPSSITKAEIRQLIESKAMKYPAAARTLWDALQPFFKWMLGQDIIVTNPMTGLQPPPAPASRDRVLSHLEIKIVWAVATDMGYPFGDFFKFLLVTGQRRSEVSDMRWLEINGPTWIIPGSRTKNKKPHLVFLSAQAFDILSSFPKEIKKGPQNFVFTTTGVAPISGFSKAKDRFDLVDWRIHDLRRTVASEMQRLGVKPEVIEKILNHSNGGLKGVYQRYEYHAERQMAMEKWGFELQTLLGSLWKV